MLQCESCDDPEHGTGITNSQEIQTINKNHLILLEHERDDLRQRVSVLETKENILRNSMSMLHTEIVSCKEMETKYTVQITALIATIEKGEVAQTLLQTQHNGRASRQVEGEVMLAHSHPGGIDRQKKNCKALVDLVNGLLQKDPLGIMPAINNAIRKKRTAWTAEEGVISSIDAIGVMDKDIAQTLRHVLFSEEFQDREFQARRNIPLVKGMRSEFEIPDSTQINYYVSNMIKSIEMFSDRLLAFDTPTGSSGLLCVIVKEFYDTGDCCGDSVVPTITQGDTSTTPVVSVKMQDSYEICGISLYNLGDQDLFFSENEIRKSAQLHNGDFLMRGRADTEVPKHNSNIVPANGFGILYRMQTDWEEETIEYHLQDANGKIAVTFNLHFKR